MRLRSAAPLLIGLAFACSAFFGIAPAIGRTSPPRATRAENKLIVEVPFEAIDGLVFLKVRVNDSAPLSFVLDSGASHSVINDSRLAQLGLRDREREDVEDAGVGESAASVGVVENVALTIGGLKLSPQMLAAINFDELAHLVGHDFDGLLGSDFFKRFVVQIDYANNVVRLLDPVSFRPGSDDRAIKFKLADGTPFVQARIAQQGKPSITGTFEIDTGSSSAIAFSVPFVAKHDLLARVSPKMTDLGSGVGGENTQIIGRIGALELGGYAFRTPAAGFPQVKAGFFASGDHSGLIGSGILRRFVVTFDYRRGRMFLKPNERFAEPFDIDMSGINLRSEGANFTTHRVYRVKPDSPASEAGLRNGDIIKSIDGKDAAALQAAEIRKMLKQEGREFRFVVERDDAPLTVTIKTRRLI